MLRSVFGLVLLLSASFALAADNPLFKVLEQDKSVVADVRSDASDIWIKLASAHTSDEITVRISDKARDYYRPWFNDSVDLVSTGYRGNDVWSDRVQTKARYVEYWSGDRLVLHLERK